VAAGHFVACHLYTEPSRAGLAVRDAQQEVTNLVKVGADVVFTNARRLGLDPKTGKALDDTAAADRPPASETDGLTAPSIPEIAALDTEPTSDA
jgi:hypothetical protein